MRQAGVLKDGRDANRFAAWLVSQRIEAHAEQEDGGWAIWVRDEDQLPKAREELAKFQASPQDERYRNAQRTAEQVVREEEEQRKRVQGNIVEMRGRWSTGGAVVRRCPLVLGLIGASILVTLFASNDSAPQGAGANTLYDLLLFTDPQAGRSPDGFDVWASIRRGEVWRLVTPIFIHYGITHLLFNMLVLFTLGGQIENRRGMRFMAFLVLLLAITSNVGQAIELSLTSPGVQFGGMSGVGYGVFGYLLIKVKFDNRDGYMLSQFMTIILIAGFVLSLARSFPEMDSVLSFMPRIANAAHTVGLFVGMALAYAPLLVRRSA
ncbi:MAG TPA: rhomboid family intramembrane serine protease [Pirellulaceae bacterium]|nr:rhomboid family intramembrane serine protease [Pirellulaceae bacterium]